MPGFKFVDVPTAAEALGVNRAQVLELMSQGRLKPFDGAGQSAVFRTRDIETLLAELRAERSQASAAGAQAGPEPVSLEVAPRKRLESVRRDPVKKVGTRLSQDVRWTEISDDDLDAWFDAQDRRSYAAVRHAARGALRRLTRIMQLTGGLDITAEDRVLAESGAKVNARDLLGGATPESGS